MIETKETKADTEAKLHEQVQDLQEQVDGLTHQEIEGMVFQHIRTNRDPVTLYAMTDGEPITIPKYMVAQAKTLRRESGELRFTARKEDAPTYKRGDIKCFLHLESPDRPMVDAAGLTGKTCKAAHLGSNFAKNIHGERRHSREWAAFRSHMDGVREAEKRDEARQQLEATLTIARAAQAGAEAKAPQAAGPEAAHDCEDCDWQQRPSTKNKVAALAAHQREKHPAGGE